MTVIPSPADRPRDNITGVAVFVAALVVSLWFTRVGWHNRLDDTHAFRQTQTALSAYWMLRDGIRLDYSTPVMGVPWSIPMEFPAYQAAIAIGVRVTGLPLESVARGLSLFFFYSALPAIWLLLRRLRVAPSQSWLFLAMVLTCPIYLFYSRTIFIESTAFCFGCWFLYCFHVSLHTRYRGDILVAAVFGIAAGLVKVTTYAVFLAPAAALGVSALIQHRGQWRGFLARGCAAALPGVAAASAWTWYADTLKRQNVFGVMMTSIEQRDWNYGPLALRFEGRFWDTCFAHIRYTLAPTAALIAFAMLALLFLRRSWRLPLILLSVVLAGPLVFANLYWVHDYYWYSNGIFILALLALPLREMFRAPEVSWLGRWGAAVMILLAQFLGYLGGYYPRQAKPATEAPAIAQALKAVTRPDDVALGFAMNWTSVLPYYSERRAVMVPDKFIRDDAAIAQAIAKVGADRIAAVVIYRLGPIKPEFFSPWLPKLGMDEKPFLQTGEYSLHLRKERLPEALKIMANTHIDDVLLYGGDLGPPGQRPPLVYWVDHVPDRSVFSMMSPEPMKVTVPFGLASELLGGRKVFTAHSTSEVEIKTPPNARHVSATFGLNPAVYDRSDGIEVEIIYAPANAGRQELYRHYLRPAVVKADQGPHDVELETTGPMNGTVLFRILPGGGPNFDWAYWARIEIR